MRMTLEQLKAMSDDQLSEAWIVGKFPFDWMDKCGCLLQHQEYKIKGCEHVEIRRAMEALPSIIPCGHDIRPHLEQLYALRIFFDALYAPAEVEALAEEQVSAT